MPEKITPQQLVAHRGYQHLYPENTALSVSGAIDAGALFVEIDIQLSLDLQAMVYHDSSLERVSGLDADISSLPLYQLETLSAFEPDRLGNQFVHEKISSLANVVDIIRQHPEVTLFVELKQESIEQHGRDKMLQAVCSQLEPIKQRAVLISFDYDIIQNVSDSGWPQVGVVLRNWEDINSHQVTVINGDYCFVNYQIIPDKADLSELQTKLVAYEVDDRQLARELLDRGVAMVETFNIELLLS